MPDLRFALVYIERRARDLPSLQSRDERSFLYHGPARSVDEEGGRFHQTQFTRADQSSRGWEERDVQAQEIGFSENGVTFHVLRSQFIFHLNGRANCIVINHTHGKTARSARHCPADAAETQDA